MPLNFPETKKWVLTSLLASITFISPLASSMFAPGVTFADKEFHNTSGLLSSFTVSIFVLGYVVGPLILAPLSEIYGRRYVLTGGNIIFCLWQIGCALAPSLGTLIGFRFMAGLGGSGCLTIGAGMIADLFHADRRGLATSLFSLGPLFGPVIGPIAGGIFSISIPEAFNLRCLMIPRFRGSESWLALGFLDSVHSRYADYHWHRNLERRNQSTPSHKTQSRTSI